MKLDTFVQTQTLTEGMKIDQEMIQSILNDPDIRCGFEVEFANREYNRASDEDSYYSIDDVRGKLERELNIYPHVYEEPDRYKPDYDPTLNFKDEVLDTKNFDYVEFSRQFDVIKNVPEYKNFTWENTYYDRDSVSGRLLQLFNAYFAKQADMFGNEYNGKRGDYSGLYEYLKDRLGMPRLAILLKMWPKKGFDVSSEFYESNFDDFEAYNDHLRDTLDDLNIRKDSAVEGFLKLIGTSKIINDTYKDEYTRAEQQEELHSDWILTTDASVVGGGENGFELVAPIQGIETTLSDIKMIFDWLSKNEFETTERAGFHVSMSYRDAETTKKLDILKLGVLLDEENLLKQFDRLENEFTVSQIANIKAMIRDEMKNEIRNKGLDAILEELRSHFILNHWTSINVSKLKNYGYIEFRIMGGANYHTKFDETRRNKLKAEIRRTILKYAIVLRAGIDPDAFRNVYLKKLYAILDKQTTASKAHSKLVSSDLLAKSIHDAAMHPEETLRQYARFSHDMEQYKLTHDENHKQSAIDALFKMMVTGLATSKE